MGTLWTFEQAQNVDHPSMWSGRLCQEWWVGHAGIQWFQTLAGRQETGKPVSRGWVRRWD